MLLLVHFRVDHKLSPPKSPAAGHNCLKAELVVTDRGWALRDKFLAALRAKLCALPPRVAYYPGSQAKHAAFLAKFPAAERLGTPEGSGDGAALASAGDSPEVKPTPWLLQAGLSPDEVSPGLRCPQPFLTDL